MCTVISQDLVSHSRMRGVLPVWATASIVPSGAHCRLATGPLLRQRRSVTHHGVGWSEKRAPCGHTRTMPRAPAVARHLPSGDHVTAGHANGSPCMDQPRHQPSFRECRKSATPEDIPRARAPQTLLGCQARHKAKPWLLSMCKYCVVLPEKTSPKQCTATVPAGESVAKTSRWGCHAMLGAGVRLPCAVAGPPTGCPPGKACHTALAAWVMARSTQCSKLIHPARLRCSMSFSSSAPALPQRCKAPRSPASAAAAAPRRTAAWVACWHCLKAGGAPDARPACASGAKAQQRHASQPCGLPAPSGAGGPAATVNSPSVCSHSVSAENASTTTARGSAEHSRPSHGGSLRSTGRFLGD
mmetsp:Transcript_60374/g.187422  ORF Transcript_60374/g.187422 Transcript_60374/m.187422 type:complete len:357 (-) Transcript_60374:54-1124(-)